MCCLTMAYVVYRPKKWIKKHCPPLVLLSGMAGDLAGKDGAKFNGGGSEVGGRGGILNAVFSWNGAISS